MRVLQTRLRLTRQQCADRRLHLNELQMLAQKLCADAQRVRDEAEQAGPNNPVAWPLIERYGKLQRSIADLEEQIVAARTALSASEQELRQHERTSLSRAPRHR